MKALVGIRYDVGSGMNVGNATQDFTLRVLYVCRGAEKTLKCKGKVACLMLGQVIKERGVKCEDLDWGSIKMKIQM